MPFQVNTTHRIKNSTQSSSWGQFNAKPLKDARCRVSNWNYHKFYNTSNALKKQKQHMQPMQRSACISRKSQKSKSYHFKNWPRLGHSISYISTQGWKKKTSWVHLSLISWLIEMTLRKSWQSQRRLYKIKSKCFWTRWRPLQLLGQKILIIQ